MTSGTHDASTTRTARWRSAIAAGIFVFATPAGAGLIPGGGPAASDCYAELDIAGVENATPAVKRNRIVKCVDGDPCDSGPCGDGVCDFQVRLCWNQHDPNVPACVPPPVLQSLDLRGPLAALMLMPRDLGGTTCTDFTDFGVPTNPDGKRSAHLNVRMIAKALPGTKPLVDNDVIRLVCVPRPYNECGGATTTTLEGATTTVPTTTLPGVTTTLRATTTTRTTTSSTSTTRRRPRQTTTTTRPTTTSTRAPTTTRPPTTTSTSTTSPAPTTSTTVTPTTSLPETTGAPTTTTPTFAPTTTTRRRKKDDGGSIIGIPLPPL